MIEALSATVSADGCQLLTQWFDQFVEALTEKNYQRLDSVLSGDCYWRDLLAFGWTFTARQNLYEISGWLIQYYEGASVTNLQLAGEPAIRGLGTFCSKALESLFAFETKFGHCPGCIRLNLEPALPYFSRAITTLTEMQDLRDFLESTRLHRPPQQYKVSLPDVGEQEPIMGVVNPHAVIIGLGQPGPMIVARLHQLGVDALFIEKTNRIGDVWYEYYKSLKLYNEFCISHFPSLPFPETYSVYLSRGKVVQWLEFYGRSTELNIATSTTFLSSAVDESIGGWAVRLSKATGQEVELRPSHVTFAAGVSGYPDVPRNPDSMSVTGRAFHSSESADDPDVKSKKILGVGAGTSAHDIAQMADPEFRLSNFTVEKVRVTENA